jgi:hypothetical protein
MSTVTTGDAPRPAGHYSPARTTVSAGLHGFRIEIDAVLHLPPRA